MKKQVIHAHPAFFLNNVIHNKICRLLHMFLYFGCTHQIFGAYRVKITSMPKNIYYQLFCGGETCFFSFLLPKVYYFILWSEVFCFSFLNLIYEVEDCVSLNTAKVITLLFMYKTSFKYHVSAENVYISRVRGK